MLETFIFICSMMLLSFIFWGAFVIEEFIMTRLTGKGLLEQMIELIDELELRKR